MIEIFLIVCAVVAMSKIADAEGRSSFLWGLLTLVICIASDVFIPLPLLRILIALIIAFIAMMVVKGMGR